MARQGFSSLQNSSGGAQRDSLELASLASTSASGSKRSSLSSPAGISSSRKLSLENEDPLSAANPAANSPRPGRHDRSYSVSSAFDFASNLFPLSATSLGEYAPIGDSTSGGGAPATSVGGGLLERRKSISFMNGLSLVVGLVIGSGIFASPSQVDSKAGSPGASLIIWLVAGALAWTGAASYSELGGAIPLNGGAQIYLTKIFGELFGFLFTWCAVCVLKPGSAAIIAIVFGEYVVRAAVGADAENVSGWINKGVAFGGLILVTAINCISTRLGTRIGDFFMFFKFIALLGVTFIGIVVAVTGYSWHGEANVDWKGQGWFDGTSKSVSSWAVALYAGLWAFDGWDNVSYVVGELRRPRKDLPRIIHTSMPIVIVAYMLANIAYYFVLPLDLIKSSNTVAVQFGSRVFGPVGAFVLALIVGGSCLGALNATTFTSGRLVYAASKEGYMPGIFGKLGFGNTGEEQNSNRRDRVQGRSSNRMLSRLIGDDENGLGFTPVNAMLLNLLLTTAYIVVGEFKTLLTFYGVAGYSFYFLTVLGLIVLRVKEPLLERPYKTWITTPIIFCCVSLFLLSRAVFVEPLQTIVVVVFILLGIPVYFLQVRPKRKRKNLSTGPAVNREKDSGWRFWKRWGR